MEQIREKIGQLVFQCIISKENKKKENGFIYLSTDLSTKVEIVIVGDGIKVGKKIKTLSTKRV